METVTVSNQSQMIAPEDLNNILLLEERIRDLTRAVAKKGWQVKEVCGNYNQIELAKGDSDKLWEVV